MLLIPFTNSPADSFTCQLGDGVKYVFDTRYNTRGGFWTFDLTRQIDQVLLVAAVPILLGQDLLDPYTLGSGMLVAIDNGGTGADAGPTDLGVRVQVYWMSAEEIAAAVASP